MIDDLSPHPRPSTHSNGFAAECHRVLGYADVGRKPGILTERFGITIACPLLSWT
jgi:hypothetical protein